MMFVASPRRPVCSVFTDARHSFFVYPQVAAKADAGVVILISDRAQRDTAAVEEVDRHRYFRRLCPTP